ncbi:hypothetical protein D3C80_1947000 [compost metagenome]
MANRVSISSAAGRMPWAFNEAMASLMLAVYCSSNCSGVVPAGAWYRQGIGTARAWAPKGSGEGNAVVTWARDAELPW